MTEGQSQVRVELRTITLAAGAALHELSDGRVFIELSEPPPIRTVLRVRGEDGETRAFEIGHVVEIQDADPIGARGCYGAFADDAKLEEHEKVGSEALGPGASQASGPEPESDAGADAAAEPAQEASDAEADAAPEDDEAGPSDGEKKAQETTSSGGKKRKGRKRR